MRGVGEYLTHPSNGCTFTGNNINDFETTMIARVPDCQFYNVATKVILHTLVRQEEDYKSIDSTSIQDQSRIMILMLLHLSIAVYNMFALVVVLSW